jgi:peptidoglycan hydrolase CwlO-like protein
MLVDALAATIVAHDNQIDAIIKVTGQNAEQIGKLGEQIGKVGEQIGKIEEQIRELKEVGARNERLFMAYLNRLPPQ